MAWTDDRLQTLRELWASGATASAIGNQLGLTRNAVIGKAHRLGLPGRPARGGPRPARTTLEDAQAQADAARAAGKGIRKAFKVLGDDVTLSRFVKIKGERRVQDARPRQIALPGLGRPAIEAGRSVFYRKGVSAPEDVPNVLVSGHSNVKIGRDVRKGPLRGYWIYTLSLEERRTCPRSCHHWATCYGNHMPYANRIEHGPGLLRALEAEIPRKLAVADRAGILVRLHALGDFYSAEYVRFWQTMLALHPRLACYGYTAHAPDSEIGAAVRHATSLYGWDRFAIRFSNGGEDDRCTVPIRSVDDPVNGAVICPEQTGRTAACATCGICWNSRRNVAFLEH